MQHYGFAMTATKRVLQKRIHKWVLIRIKKKSTWPSIRFSISTFLFFYDNNIDNT